MGEITAKQATTALDDMDDFARMDVGVDAKGPRETLERFIDQHERIVAGLEARLLEAEGLLRDSRQEVAGYVGLAMLTGYDEICEGRADVANRIDAFLAQTAKGV